MVIVLDDSFNSFRHFANCILKIIPGLNEKIAWDLTIQVDKSGSVEVRRCNLEQAELYHKQLVCQGLTMAPLENI